MLHTRISIAACIACACAFTQAQEISIKPLSPAKQLAIAKAGELNPLDTERVKEVLPIAPIQPAPLTPTWEIRLQDVNLANTFSRWATESGWRVRWDARKHILVEAPDRINGSFESAVTAVLEGPGIAGSAYPLEVCFYPNTPPLARVTRKGEQDKECQ